MEKGNLGRGHHSELDQNEQGAEKGACLCSLVRVRAKIITYVLMTSDCTVV